MSLAGLLPLLSNLFPFHDGRIRAGAGHEPPAYAARQGVRPLFVAALWQQAQAPTLVLTPRPDDSRLLHDQLLTYLGEDAPVFLLPEPEVLPFERLAVDARTVNQRLVALAALAGWEKGQAQAPLVITSVAAALRYTLSPAIFEGGDADEAGRRVRLGQRIPGTERLLKAWVNLGYRHEPIVENPGCFNLRGGIIDVFPPQAEYPYRLELWDDEVDTIRRFDPNTQRSLPLAEGGEAIQQLELIPAREQLPELADRAALELRFAEMDLSRCTAIAKERFEEDLTDLLATPNMETLSFYNGLLNRYNLMDYLPPEGLLVLDRQSQLETEANDLEEKFFRMRESRESRGDLPRNFPSPYLGWEQFSGRLWEHPIRARLESWLTEEEEESAFRVPEIYHGRLEEFTRHVKQELPKGRTFVAVSQHTMRLSEILGEAGIASSIRDVLTEAPAPGQVYLLPGFLGEGWEATGSPGHPAVTL